MTYLFCWHLFLDSSYALARMLVAKANQLLYWFDSPASVCVRTQCAIKLTACACSLKAAI